MQRPEDLEAGSGQEADLSFAFQESGFGSRSGKPYFPCVRNEMVRPPCRNSPRSEMKDP